MTPIVVFLSLIEFARFREGYNHAQVAFHFGVIPCQPWLQDWVERKLWYRLASLGEEVEQERLIEAGYWEWMDRGLLAKQTNES